jgi:hypothetical protein
MKRLIRFFSNPIYLSILNAVLIVGAVIGNYYWQVFCNPSQWAKVFIGVCFLYTMTLPLMIKHKKFNFVTGFLSGISFWMYIYCVIFLAEMNIWGLIIIFTGAGILTFIPHFLAFQIWYKIFFLESSKVIRQSFVIGSLCCLLGVLGVGYLYSSALEDITEFENSEYKQLEPNFFNEKILGMHLIYHTKFCGYDGWRPPIHEPLLVIGLWMNGGEWGINVPLEKRMEFYQKFFPDKPVHLECSCAKMYSWNYHNDVLFK